MPDEVVARARTPRPTPNVERRGYDPARLARGSIRGVVKMGPMQFRVEGRHERFYDVNLELDTPCDCADAMYRGRPCLHELAARLASGELPLVQALGERLLRRERVLREAGLLDDEGED